MGLVPRATLCLNPARFQRSGRWPPPFSTLGSVALTLGVEKPPLVVLSTARLSQVLHCLSVSKASAHPRVLGAGVAAGVAAGWGRTAVRSMSPAGRDAKAAAGARPPAIWGK